MVQKASLKYVVKTKYATACKSIQKIWPVSIKFRYTVLL